MPKTSKEMAKAELTAVLNAYKTAKITEARIDKPGVGTTKVKVK